LLPFVLRKKEEMKPVSDDYRRDYGEELADTDILTDVVNVIGVFLVSALWVVYLAYLFGPVIP
jgi:hypothetical protein